MSNAVPVHKLIRDGSATNRTLTLSDTGAVDGQIKHIYQTSGSSGGHFILNQTNRIPTVAHTFQDVGDGASFIFDATSSNWVEISIAGTSGS